jgi:hypothetical protein
MFISHVRPPGENERRTAAYVPAGEFSDPVPAVADSALQSIVVR